MTTETVPGPGRPLLPDEASRRLMESRAERVRLKEARASDLDQETRPGNRRLEIDARLGNIDARTLQIALDLPRGR